MNLKMRLFRKMAISTSFDITSTLKQPYIHFFSLIPSFVILVNNTSEVKIKLTERVIGEWDEKYYYAQMAYFLNGSMVNFSFSCLIISY